MMQLFYAALIPEYKVFVKEPPIDGKANEMVISYFAELLKVSKNAVTIVHGVASKYKIIHVTLDVKELSLVLQLLGDFK